MSACPSSVEPAFKQSKPRAIRKINGLAAGDTDKKCQCDQKWRHNLSHATIQPMPFDPQRCLVLAAEGKSLRQMAQDMGCEPDLIATYRRKSPLFEQQFACARLNGLELLADDLITADQDVTDVMKARLRSENLRWLLARRIPHQYGDRLNVDVSGTIDLRAALQDANSRLDAISAEFHEVLPGSTAPHQLAPAPVIPAALAKLLD